jgi:hypothetical protein
LERCWRGVTLCCSVVERQQKAVAPAVDGSRIRPNSDIHFAARSHRSACRVAIIPAEVVMSKSMDSKKNVKKKATKTLKERREAKKAKKA